nr:outer membrane beta-barrel family protein [Pedobacter sp. ASV19]
MKILFTALLGLTAFATSGQILKGIINNSKQQAVPGAVIGLMNTTDTLFAVSNEQGRFDFIVKKKGVYRLQITCIGFSKLLLPNLVVAQDTTLNMLILKDETKNLANVTIEGTVPWVDRQLDKTIVNPARNINYEGATMLEVMQRLPGVQMTTEGQVSMAGHSGVNILIDGKPTYLSAGDLMALLAGMSASEIQRIEIMSNPSSKYEAPGTGGIINIIKKRNKKQGLNGNITAAAAQGDYRKYNGGASLNYKTEKYNIQINNTYTYSRIFDNRTVTSDILDAGNSLVTKQRSNTDAVSSTSTYRPSLGLDVFLSKKTTFSLNGTAGFDHSDNQMISNMRLLDSTLSPSGYVNFRSQLKDVPFSYSVGLQLSHLLDTAGQSFTVNVDHSQYRNDPLQNNLNTTNDALHNLISESDVLLLQHRRLDIYSFKSDYVGPLKTNATFEAGIKSSYVNAHNDNTYYDRVNGQNLINLPLSNYSLNSENINAVYVNLNKSFKKMTLQIGVRAEQTVTKGKQLLSGESVNQNYLQLFPTVFASYKLNDQNILTARFGRRIERAAYRELVPFRRPQTATLYFEGNPYLRPHLSYHAELAWAFQNTFFITLGYDLDKDYIQTFPYLDSNRITITRRPTNIQGAYSWNIDLAYVKKIINCWSIDYTGSVFQNGFDGQAAGFSLDNNGIPSVYLTANNSFTITSSLLAQADLEYNSKRQVANSTFGAYTILNIGIKHLLFNHQASISLNARNILNSEGQYVINRNRGLYQYSYLNFYTRALTLNFSYRLGSGKSVKTRMDPGSAEEKKRVGN